MLSMLRRSFKKYSSLIFPYVAFVRSSHSSDHNNKTKFDDLFFLNSVILQFVDNPRTIH
jgi:hypothetical protein